MSSTATSAGRILPLIDFHSHYVPAEYEITIAKTLPAAQQRRWAEIGRKISDESLMLKDIRDGVLTARVVNIPLNLIADADGRVPHDTIRACNDRIAALGDRHKGSIYALGAVDAYDGDVSAREAERAIRDLRLRGLFVDCSRGDALIDAPEARPTLAVAAALGVPVFVHPVAPQPLTRQMTPYGVVGTLFARGTVNSAALIALIEGGVFEDLPGLRVVVTGHAIGGIAMASGLSKVSRSAGGAVNLLRNHVLVDTQLMHPALIRAAVDLLGWDRVLAGSDWPIVDDGPIAGPLAEAMREAGLSPAEQEAIAWGNCLRILGGVKDTAAPAPRLRAS